MNASFVALLLFLGRDVSAPTKDRALIDECLRQVPLDYKACVWKAAQTSHYEELVQQCKSERSRQEAVCREQRSEPWL